MESNCVRCHKNPAYDHLIGLPDGNAYVTEGYLCIECSADEPPCNICHGVFIGERGIPVGMNSDTGDVIYLCVGCALEAASESGGG